MLELEIIAKMILAVFLGGVIGYEREVIRKPAGLRTHMLVSLGSALFTVMSFTAFPADPARIASHIVIGIGFIGAGTIFQMKDKVIGLTTAACLWVTASIGMAVGVGYYLIAIVTTALTYIVLRLSRIEKDLH
ncbi:MAG: MgtC/SapB family protein [Candidatus Aenigmarchaeota archaeon]|nr:MgtC/SapB family protein [Candidatus Aenigmarchaeota archaeon]